tara:strand:- start:53996 stop:56500 length:2505 start_codon:yes stop_codon:yes gene_type:complete
MPMQKRLPEKDYFKLSTFLLLILLSVAPVCVAQIAITENKPTDIRFTLDPSTVNSSGIHLSIYELLDAHGALDQPVSSNLISYTDQAEGNPFYYISDESRYIYPGRIQSRDTEEATFFSLSINNESEHSISSMMMAFDFIYNLDDLDADYTLVLSYRVNDNQWRNVSGSTFRTEILNENSEEWNSFSMQLNLTDIFLRENDNLDLRWDFIGHDKDEIEPMLPLAIQRMEIYPENPSFQKIQSGQLVITEILTSVDIDGIPVEYIELFNSSEVSIPLKGMELKSAEGSVVIQRDLNAEPYETVVLSNVDLSGMSGVETYYNYEGSILRYPSGRIEVIREDVILTRAAYESSEPGVSLELDRVANAISGYTSLQNLQPSENVLIQDLKGSPGELMSTVPLYSRTLEREGWYFIAPPGKILERLNRHPSLEFFGLNGRSIEIDQIRPYTPIMIFKSDENPIQLYVEKVELPTNDRGVRSQNVKREFRITSFNAPEATNLRFIAAEGEQKMAPLVKVWDENSQKFQMKFSNQDQIEGWNPFLLNSDLSANLEMNTGGYQAGPIDLSRYIPLNLFEGSGSNRVKSDEAIIGFMDQKQLNGNISYDLPKLSATFDHENALPEMSALYLTSPESKYRANSFVQLSKEFDQPISVGLGFDPVPGSSGPATLEWSLEFDIPDEWNITLEDIQTGIVVDMREVNNYRFRYTSQEPEENANTVVTGLSNYIPKDRNRFTVTVEKFEPLVQAELEDEKPGSIELRQNYPNPFNPATNITFYLPEERNVRVGVYNIVGQQVSLLIDDVLQAGEHSVVWDAANNPSGIYIVQMETGSRLLTRKITLIK